MAKPDANKKKTQKVTKTAPPAQPKQLNTRAAKIEAATKGHTFTLVSPDPVVGEFTCICGGKGKRAFVVKNEKGNKIKVGATCLAHCGVELPKKEKAAAKPAKGKKAAKTAKADEVAEESTDPETVAPGEGETPGEGEGEGDPDKEFEFLDT